mmetsp:Transcript_40586/g.129442  ORF Transcript_40586/g.129442 Transcript_40586/m.129442 type:complete len:657 (-) Transcript_40586:106-2076(-)
MQPGLQVAAYCLGLVISFIFQVRLVGVVSGLLWLYLFQFLALFKAIGPFFIMVIEMLRRDVAKFMMLLLVVIPGFTLASSVMFRVCSEEERVGSDEFDPLVEDSFSFKRSSTMDPKDWADLGAAFYSLTLMAFNLQTWPRHNACADGAPAIVLMGFLVLVPLVLVNLLIAMFSETYVRIQGHAIHTWKLWQAQYIMKREGMLPNSWTQFESLQGPYEFVSHRDDVFIPGLSDASGGGIYEMAAALMEEIRQLRQDQREELDKIQESQRNLVEMVEGLAKGIKPRPSRWGAIGGGGMGGGPGPVGLGRFGGLAGLKAAGAGAPFYGETVSKEERRSSFRSRRSVRHLSVPPVGMGTVGSADNIEGERGRRRGSTRNLAPIADASSDEEAARRARAGGGRRRSSAGGSAHSLDNHGESRRSKRRSSAGRSTTSLSVDNQDGHAPPYLRSITAESPSSPVLKPRLNPLRSGYGSTPGTPMRRGMSSSPGQSPFSRLGPQSQASVAVVMGAGIARCTSIGLDRTMSVDARVPGAKIHLSGVAHPTPRHGKSKDNYPSPLALPAAAASDGDGPSQPPRKEVYPLPRIGDTGQMPLPFASRNSRLQTVGTAGGDDPNVKIEKILLRGTKKALIVPTAPSPSEEQLAEDLEQLVRGKSSSSSS